MSSEDSVHDPYAADVAAIQAIDIVPQILSTLCAVTGMGFAAVARVTEDRWVACQVDDRIAFGLEPGGELEIQTTLCNEIRQCGEPIVIGEVAKGTNFANHPTPALYGFQSYVSVPILTPDGQMFGTLCAIDPNPASVERPEIISMFNMFAQLIGFHLSTSDRLRHSETNLSDERRVAQLREQFIAVLGHDLRNPLAAVEAGLYRLRRLHQSANTTAMLDQMLISTARMDQLIGDVLDFARGRLGGGLTLDRRPTDVDQLIRRVADEVAAAHPGRHYRIEGIGPTAFDCDPARLAQLLSNLVGNAFHHGDAREPVLIRIEQAESTLAISIQNSGDEIPADARARLFEPFQRSGGGEGLGLGLYIAAEIARAHGGALSLETSPGLVTFTCTLPR